MRAVNIGTHGSIIQNGRITKWKLVIGAEFNEFSKSKINKKGHSSYKTSAFDKGTPCIIILPTGARIFCFVSKLFLNFNTAKIKA